nr:ADM_HP1_G0015130.mRNA.1.CDS.1 [Saccharomyces cerevisiae]
MTKFSELSNSIRTTMWQIRHVLNEKELAYSASRKFYRMNRRGKSSWDTLANDYFLNKDIPDDEVAPPCSHDSNWPFSAYRKPSRIIQSTLTSLNGIKFLANLKLQAVQGLQ